MLPLKDKKVVGTSLPQDADIYIASCGLVPWRDMTLETLFLLRSGREIISMFSCPSCRAFLTSERLAFQDISGFYESNKDFKSIYQRVARYVLSRAQDKPGVIYLTYGNPMVLDEPSLYIGNAALQNGMKLHIASAVSFLDVILTSRNIHIGRDGYTICEARWLMDRRVKINARIPCFVAQMGALGHDTASGEAAPETVVFEKFVDYLLNYYPPTHWVTLCDSESDSMKPLFLDIPVGHLKRARGGFTYATTLYLPPVT